jgi:hypothetical protein
MRKRPTPTPAEFNRWLLLIHQIPPKPPYLRVKVWRRLQRIGAVAMKNSVYVLPASEQAREDLEWVLREIVSGGGDGSVVEARLVEGLTDEAVRALFVSARDADYAQLAEEARSLLEKVAKAPRSERDTFLATKEKLRARLAEVEEIDFFGAPGRDAVEGLLASIVKRLGERTDDGEEKRRAVSLAEYRGRVWVTRKSIHVDRMASAWLIRRFIDPKARMKFVDGNRYAHRARDLRFDMFGGEFTHEGDLCTFEVLKLRFALAGR